MNVSRIGRRLATAGVATALAAGALVGASATSATAAFSATSTYTCNVLGTDVPMPLTATVPLLPPSANAGTTIPPNLLNVSTVLTIPGAVASQLGVAGVTGGAISNFGMLVGETLAPAPLNSVVFGAPATDGSVLATASGQNGTFTLPAAGVYDITLPKTFTFVPSGASGPLPISVPCTTEAPAKMSSVTILKNDSITDAKAPARVAKGTRAKVTTVVASANAGTPTPTGKVIAKLGTKTIGSGTLSAGKAVMKLAKMSVGKHKVVVKYLGDAYTKAGKDAVVIKVTR